jgi:hypothetical protein
MVRVLQGPQPCLPHQQRPRQQPGAEDFDAGDRRLQKRGEAAASQFYPSLNIFAAPGLQSFTPSSMFSKLESMI